MDELDPDPARAASLEDLAACLRHIHLLADKPALPRTLEKDSVREGGSLPGSRLKRVKLARSTVSETLLGRKLPGKAFLLSFVDACGIDLEADRRWEQASDWLAVQYQQSSAPEEADKLRKENDELNRRLAEMQHRADVELERLRADAEARRMSAERELGELRRQLAAAEHQAETAEGLASQEQARARTAESQLDLAIRRAATAESLLEWEWQLFDGRFMSVEMPYLGEACTEGTVIRWLKEEGERVEAAEPLLEVSSGMTSTEILSPAACILRDIATVENETAPVGAQLAMIKETRPAAQEPSGPSELRMQMLVAVYRRGVDPAPAGSAAPANVP